MIQLESGNCGFDRYVDIPVEEYSCAVRLANVPGAFLHNPASWSIARFRTADGS